MHRCEDSIKMGLDAVMCQSELCACSDKCSVFIEAGKFLITWLNTWFVQKVSGLTTVHEVDKAYRILTLIVVNIVPLRSYTLRPTFLPLLETFCELLFRDV